MSEPTSDLETQPGDELLGELAEDFLRRHRAGERPSLEVYAAKHPELAQRIRDLFPAVIVMEQPGAVATADFAPPTERVGATIGRYKLLERIGEGGFGIVYMAVQQQPIRRKVALKVIKPGFDTEQIIGRFEAERQALALMDHPNIAKVLDAGATETGRPYFVMELVRGIPITKYCDQERIATETRLDLFMKVCQAIQHAHTKGIIHRDIKPSNILVTLHDGVPVPKVIDFGIAKAVQQELSEKTIFTQFQQFIGTPAYMSPEQAEMSGLDVDTRSDVYSLGVLLYELLTGSTPFDAKELMRSGLDAMRKIIREREPLTPSSRLTQERQSTTNTDLNRHLTPAGHPAAGSRHLSIDKDLDWIVMKCLEKDRTRRYDTASGLASDVERYLRDEPVEACPPSAVYRFRKFVRRNKGPVVAAGVVLLTLIAGVVGTSLGLFRARAEAVLARLAESAATQDRDRANRARQQADKARLDERRLNFQMAFDRGLALCDQGQVASGMLWLARSLELAPPDDVAMKRVIRANLTAWKRELHTLQAIYPNNQGVNSVAISPDGTLVLTGTIDGVVQLWDRRSGLARGAPLRHRDEVHEVLFSPDGTFFLTASIDQTACLRDTNSGQLIHTFPHDSAVWGALFTGDGRIVTSNSDGEIQVWDPDTGNLIDAWGQMELGSVHDLALSPDGKQLLGACDAAGVVLLWDLQTHKLIARFAGHTARVPTAVFVGPNRIASADTDGNVYLWKWPQVRHGGSADGTIRHGESAAGMTVGPVDGEKISEPWRHRGGVHRLRVRENGSQLLTASYDNTAQLLDSQNGKPIGVPFEHHGGLKSVAFSKDGNILTACEDDGAREWRPAPGSLLRTPFVHDAGTEQALCTPDAKYVLIRRDKTASIRRALTGEQLGMPFEPGGGVHGFAISPDESKFMTAGGKVQFWESATGLPFGKSFQHRGATWAVAISPDGKHAVSGGLDGVAKLWDARTGVALPEPLVALQNAPIRGVAFSPDGSRIGIASSDKLAWVVRTEGRDAPRKLAGHHGSVMTLAFSHDSKLVATGSWDKTVVVWDVETGSPVSKPMRHGGPFWYAVAFSRDGKTLVAGCDDHTARVWDIATSKPIGAMLPHDAALRTAAFTENDSQIITGTSSGTTYIWDVSRSPLEGSVEWIALWLQVSTGMELGDDGEIRPLSPASWQQRRETLEQFGDTPIAL